MTPVCSECGSEDVSAWTVVYWNKNHKSWESTDLVEDFFCNECNSETDIDWKETE